MSTDMSASDFLFGESPAMSIDMWAIDLLVSELSSADSPVTPELDRILPTLAPAKRRSTIDLQRSPVVAATRRLEVNRACAKRFYQRGKTRREALRAEVSALEAKLKSLLEAQQSTQMSSAQQNLIAISQELLALRDERQSLLEKCEEEMKRCEALRAIAEAEGVALEDEIAE